ncbi:MAG: hypothetical protein DRJ03_07990 [Chloroflexi bacterium]|nr:MAG: hypothetical protein DRJ03_07990 [Chloroflexota bacterium]
MSMRDIERFYRVEWIDIYHAKGITTNNIETDDPASVFEYFKEMKESIESARRDFPEFCFDDVIIRADFIAVRDVSDEFVKLWLICEQVTGFNVSKIDGHHNVVEKFKNCELTADDYQWAFNTFYQQFQELLG